MLITVYIRRYFARRKNYWSKIMWKDPIVEEIHKIREKLAKEANYDVHQLIKNMRKREKESKAKVVSRTGKKTTVQ